MMKQSLNVLSEILLYRRNAQVVESYIHVQLLVIGAQAIRCATYNTEISPFEMTVPEVMNRVTITGSIEIGRYPGVITITFQLKKPYN